MVTVVMAIITPMDSMGGGYGSQAATIGCALGTMIDPRLSLFLRNVGILKFGVLRKEGCVWSGGFMYSAVFRLKFWWLACRWDVSHRQ